MSKEPSITGNLMVLGAVGAAGVFAWAMLSAAPAQAAPPSPPVPPPVPPKPGPDVPVTPVLNVPPAPPAPPPTTFPPIPTKRFSPPTSQVVHVSLRNPPGEPAGRNYPQPELGSPLALAAAITGNAARYPELVAINPELLSVVASNPGKLILTIPSDWNQFLADDGIIPWWGRGVPFPPRSSAGSTTAPSAPPNYADLFAAIGTIPDPGERQNVLETVQARIAHPDDKDVFANLIVLTKQLIAEKQNAVVAQIAKLLPMSA